MAEEERGGLAPGPEPVPEPVDDETFDALRVRVFDRIHAGAAALALVTFPLLLWGAPVQGQTLGFGVMFVAVVGAYLLRRWLDLDARVYTLVLTLFAIGAHTLALLGYAPGSALLFMLAAVIAAIWIRPRVALAVAVLAAACVWAVLLLERAGLWIPPLRSIADPSRTPNLVRLATTYTCLSLLLISAVAYTITVIERHARQREAALAARRNAETALAQAQKLELVGQLASGICHDFNNALSVILAWAEIMRRGPADDRSEGLEAIKQAALSSAQLTRRLLVLGRPTGRDVEVVQLDRHLPELVRMLQHVLPENIEVRCRTDGVPPIVADRGEIDHAVLNLALNARDAMPDGGTLDVRTFRGAPRAGGAAADGGPAGHRTQKAADAAGAGEAWVGLEVGDSGTGMNAATQARLFQPFFSTKGARGTGLGLASVRAIATEFGGTVEVDSAVGRGTRFTLWFPARPDASATSAIAAPPPRVRGVTILLAEDDAAVRRVMTATLRGAGHEVLDAATADAAIEIARRTRGNIALLCTDAVMPGGGVRALVDAFRELYPDAPVLVCSGYLSPELPTPGELDAAFLAKPFTPTALVAKVHEILALGHAPPRTPLAGTPTLPAQAQRS